VDVRPGEERDLEQINEIYNHYVRETPITFDIDEVTMGARREWFAHYSTEGRYRLLVADEDSVLAYATSSQLMTRKAYETSVMTSVYCAADAMGRGIGSMLYASLFESLEGEDVHRAYGGITIPNPASVALHERFGFRQVAYFTEQGRKFDKYWDVAWFEKEF
jgi:phosphinothricin acetyltransferase